MLDLTKPFTTQDVEKLIASKDDSEHRQLRVTTSGMAFISDDYGSHNIHGILFRLETWSAGTNHVGADAAADPKWVAEVEADLRANWPTPKGEYIDF